jgi:hypothetical protein
MRSKLEHAIKYESAALEKHVTPVPTIVLDDIVSLSLYPQVEPDQGYSSEPSVRESYWRIYHSRIKIPSKVHSKRQALGDTEANKCEHAVREEVTSVHIPSV